VPKALAADTGMGYNVRIDMAVITFFDQEEKRQ